MRRLPALLVFGVMAAAAQNALWVDLSGEWRHMPGDQPEYARPDFDDSGWERLSLPDPLLSQRRGFRWFRKRVELPEGADRSQLALTVGIPGGVWDVYVNGQLIPRRGGVDDREHAPIPAPETYSLPEPALNGGRDVVIAIRARRLTMPGQWRMPDTGPYLITSRSAAPVREGLRQLHARHTSNTPQMLFSAAYGMAALLILIAWWGYRSRTELLWFGLMLLAHGWNGLRIGSALARGADDFTSVGVPVLSLLMGFHLPLLTCFVFSVTEAPTLWFAVLWLVWACTQVIRSLSEAADVSVFQGAVVFCAGFALIAIVSDFRKRRAQHSRESFLLRLTLLIPVLYTLTWYAQLLLRVPQRWAADVAVGPYEISGADLALLPLVVIITVLLLRRLAADRREQQRLASEVEAARTVQQLLVPASSLAGVDAVYRPAQEVGGDFWQALPLDDGGRLIVVGDVSGKGLKAAMVVSLLTGAIRNRKSDEPAGVLAELNRVMAGGLEGGFVTAVAARIGADGVVRIASAGHPPIYVDGAEIELEPGLPLGIDATAEYDERERRLAPGQQLTFVSDGVAEAANASGELFGFERVRDISGRAAGEIADAARAWGQNDDITVVTVNAKAAAA